MLTTGHGNSLGKMKKTKHNHCLGPSESNAKNVYFVKPARGLSFACLFIFVFDSHFIVLFFLGHFWFVNRNKKKLTEIFVAPRKIFTKMRITLTISIFDCCRCHRKGSPRISPVFGTFTLWLINFIMSLWSCHLTRIRSLTLLWSEFKIQNLSKQNHRFAIYVIRVCVCGGVCVCFKFSSIHFPKHQKRLELIERRKKRVSSWPKHRKI